MYFIKALIISSVLPTKPTASTNQMHVVNSEASAVFCLEMLTTITLLNQDRIIFVWCVADAGVSRGRCCKMVFVTCSFGCCRVLVYEHFAGIIQAAQSPSLHVEKAIICLLLLCVKLIHKEEIRDRVLRALEIFLVLSASVADAMSETIAVGLSKLLQSSWQCVRSLAGWQTIFTLLHRCAKHPGARDRALNALRTLIEHDAAGRMARGALGHANAVGSSNAATSNGTTMPSGVRPILDKDTLLPCFNALVGFASVPSGPLRLSTDGTSIDTDLSIYAMRSMHTLFEMVPLLCGYGTSVIASQPASRHCAQA